MGTVNPWLDDQLKKTHSPEWLNLIVEVRDPKQIEAVKQQLRAISGLSISRQAFNMIDIKAPTEMVAVIGAIPGVTVHYNMPKRILSLPPVGKIRSIIDPLIGEVKIDNVIMPKDRVNLDMVLPLSPLRFIRQLGVAGEVRMIPTDESRKVVLDVPTTLTGKGVKVAILDTGAATLCPQSLGVLGRSTCLLDPLPMDFHGHGSWCLNAATGRKATGFFGTVLGVAPEADQISIKVLHGVFGFGQTFDVIKGIEKAVQMGAKVISLSLGGDECQGTEDEDPECKVINSLSDQGIIFCVAVGNGGPGGWSVGSPGCASKAITVGSVSMTDYPRPASFSSRGPQNKNNPDGDMKPDCLCPGGGRADGDSSPDEVIYSGEEGWAKGMYSGVQLDLAGAFHGSSQATPHCAGLVACLLEGGLIRSTEDFKRVCAEKGHPKTSDDGWGVCRLSWFL